MWDNIGGKLQGLAKILCWVGIIASIVTALVLWGQNSYNQPTIGLGFLYLVLGCLGSWIGSWALFGLGLVVSYVENKEAEEGQNKPGNLNRLNSMTNIYQQNSYAQYRNDEPVQQQTVSQASDQNPTQAAELSETVTPNESQEWIDDGPNFVICPQCGRRMTTDFIKTRKKCKECGCVYTK